VRERATSQLVLGVGYPGFQILGRCAIDVRLVDARNSTCPAASHAQPFVRQPGGKTGRAVRDEDVVVYSNSFSRVKITAVFSSTRLEWVSMERIKFRGPVGRS
jgi:hypothetical protein